MPDFITTFVARQRARVADSLLGESAEAKLLGKFLDELESAYDTHQNAVLETRQAADESGYTPQAIRMLRRSGVISNRRADLPRKPGHGVVKGPQPVRDGTPSIADRALHRGGRRKIG